MFGTDFSDRQKDYNSEQTMFSLTELTIDTVKEIPKSKFQVSKSKLIPTKPTYCPINSSLLVLNSSFKIYSFSAKERDAETGLSYFGSRYYSSDLSIWLSVDPMSGKYPSLSPYVYCADNPVKCVDPNGEDYEVVVDDDNKTITIRALYYVSSDTRDKLSEAIGYIQAQEGILGYTNEEGQRFSIKFDLQIAGVYDNNDNVFNALSNSEKSVYANCCVLGQTGTPKNQTEPARGQTEVGNVITIRDDKIPVRTYMHEIGHTLGLGEWTGDNDLMKSGGEGIFISNRNIQQIMSRAGYGKMPESWGEPFDNPNMSGTSWQHVGTGKLTKIN